ncbi:hypothetical protein AAULR_21487 [Lacticaseibacillus rhamnosus MTCC 5462]|nr:hypothetical protein AAULR_21487 [Lacticaseibacillus rhamnosus MTCC 5462]
MQNKRSFRRQSLGLTDNDVTTLLATYNKKARPDNYLSGISFAAVYRA